MAKGKDNMALIKIGGAALAVVVALVLLLQFMGAFGGYGETTVSEEARQKAVENAKKATEEGAKEAGGAAPTVTGG